MGEIVITVGRVKLRARLLDTPTARIIYRILPIYSTAETWGQSVHFETKAEAGRERAASLNVKPGEIAYWSEDDRIIVAFGPTPISGHGEIRLPSPCNVFALTDDDVSVLRSVRPGSQISVTAAAPVKAPGRSRG
jgi:hypothetical protein